MINLQGILLRSIENLVSFLEELSLLLGRKIKKRQTLFLT